MRRIVVAAGFLSVIGVGSHPAWAVPLVTYEFQGQPGTQTTVAPASVAEPSVLPILAVGLVGLIGIRRSLT